MTQMFPVADVSPLEMAFPIDVSRLMPAYKDIPQDFHNRNNVWVRLVNEWFYRGLKASVLTARVGVDRNKALRHVQTVMRSFEPKHEYKVAACAYLLSQWFSEG